MILIFVSASVWGVLWIPLRVIESLGLTGLWSNFFFLVLPVLPLTYFFGRAVVRDKSNWLGHCLIGIFIGFGFACYLAGLTLGSVTKTTVDCEALTFTILPTKAPSTFSALSTATGVITGSLSLTPSSAPLSITKVFHQVLLGRLITLAATNF